MKTVSKRELNVNTAGVLDAVLPDQPAIVTERGKPRWKIESLEDGTTTINQVRCTPASSRESWKTTPLHEGTETSQTALEDLRGDRL